MITKKSLRKQVIISINSNNAERIMVKSNIYIFNINKLLKEVKSNVLADFMYSDNQGIIIITNKVAAFLDLNIIEKYIKEMNNINASNIISPRLPQSKSYLKIFGIPYFVKNTNLLIIPDIIKKHISSMILF